MERNPSRIAAASPLAFSIARVILAIEGTQMNQSKRITPPADEHDAHQVPSGSQSAALFLEGTTMTESQRQRYLEIKATKDNRRWPGNPRRSEFSPRFGYEYQGHGAYRAARHRNEEE